MAPYAKKIRARKYLLPFFLALFVLPALSLPRCGCGPSGSEETSSLDHLLALAEKVDLSRMKAEVEYMAGDELEGRPTGSPRLRILQDHLLKAWDEAGLEPLTELGLEDFRQEFEVPPDRCFYEGLPPDVPVIGVNIIGKIAGDPGEEMVIITANYDGLGRDSGNGVIYPGADYNASGASAVMELARLFSTLDHPPEMSLVFALLDAEECGNYGSQALAEALESRGLKQKVHIINLEGLGGGTGDYMDVWDLNYRKNVPTVKALNEAAALLGVEVEPGGADPGTSASTFFLYHIPAVTCDWSWFEREDHPYFHQPEDTPENLNTAGMVNVTKVVLVAAGSLAGA